MKHRHTHRTADRMWTIVLTVTTAVAMLLILHPERIGAYDDTPDTTEPTETTWPDTTTFGPTQTSTVSAPTSDATVSTTTSSTTTSTPPSSVPATSSSSSTPPPPSSTTISSPTPSLTLPTVSVVPTPSSVVSVGPPPTWCPTDNLIRRADNCEVDPCFIRPGTLTSDYQLGHAVDGRNGATVAHVVPCHIPAQHTAIPPTLELPRTGMSGPLWAYALAASVAGAALVALARRKQVTP